MTSQAYKTTVGAFVLGAIGLLALGLTLLGSGNFLKDDTEYVLYFDGSVSGLAVGAPVVFRGVPLGTVSRINLVVRPGSLSARADNTDKTASADPLVRIPVFIRIRNDSFAHRSGEQITEEQEQRILRRMISEGLRARLQLQSMITGQYRIELNFHPDTPAQFHARGDVLEIPTLPSPIDTLQRTLAKLPLDELGHALTDIVINISDALADDSLKKGIAAFAATFAETQQILTASPLRTAIDDTARAVQQEVPATLASLRDAMHSLNKAADQLNQLTSSAKGLLDKNSPILMDTRQLLRETIATVRALRQLADMLERNPEALLRGRQGIR
ncbi:MAG: MCE family protein [Desulfovibrio sp.]|nr:MCE family protein [Desulfovibrio sp.]